jgi:hypothetical protein
MKKIIETKFEIGERVRNRAGLELTVRKIRVSFSIEQNKNNRLESLSILYQVEEGYYWYQEENLQKLKD